MAKTILKIKGLKRWQKAINARGFDNASREYMRRAMALNGKVLERKQRKIIQSGEGLKDNALLTQAIKGDNKPLVDSSALFQSITSRVIDDFTVFSGVLRLSNSYNIAIKVHDGFSYKISQKMRNLFKVLSKASAGNFKGELTGRAQELFDRMQTGWFPLDESKRVIRIPPRPWIRKTFMDKETRDIIRENWKQALEMAFKDRAR